MLFEDTWYIKSLFISDDPTAQDAGEMTHQKKSVGDKMSGCHQSTCR